MLQLDPVASPCIRQCRLNAAQTCLGCFRSLEEIIDWSAAPDAARRAILARSARRRRQAGDPAPG